MFKYFILFSIFLFSYQKKFPTDWVLKKDKNQIKVYLRTLDDNSQQYRAETIVESDINSVSSHILDFNNSFKWKPSPTCEEHESAICFLFNPNFSIAPDSAKGIA